MRRCVLLSAAVALAVPAASASALNELRGSRASIRHQHEVARDQDLTFLRTAAQIREFVREERLERVSSTEYLTVSKVSFPYTRPVVKEFLERFAQQYYAATGQRLVVTSLTRPLSRQPRNASAYSVHPAGIAVDLRVPRTAAEREWLESTLLYLESLGVLDATRERRPPHYHVAVFPEQYEAYLRNQTVVEVATPAVLPTPVQPSLDTVEATVASAAESALPTNEPSAATGYSPPLALIYALGAFALVLSAGGLALRRTQ